MSTKRHPPRGPSRACSDDERYTIVVTSKAEGMDVVMYGLRRRQAERIAARKNRSRDDTTNVQLLPEDQLNHVRTD